MPQIQENARVGAKELTAMLTLFVTTDAFLNYPQFLARSGMEAAWMEPLISGAVTLVGFLLVDTFVRRYFTGLDILEICKERFGRFISSIVSLLIAGYFLVLTIVVMRQFMENVTLTVLPNTPIIVTGAVLALATGYIACCGLEGIARISYFFLPILIIGMVALCVLNANWWHVEFLFPIWGSGVNNVVLGGLKYSSIFANVLLLCIIYPHAHDPKALRKVGVLSIVLTTMLLSGFMVVYLLIFEARQADQMAFPFYQLARLIYIGRFIQRLESIFIFLWVVTAVVKLSLLIWGTSYVIGSAFKWPSLRPAIPAITLIVFCATFYPRNLVDVLQFREDFVNSWGWAVVWGLPVLIVLLATVVKPLRRGMRRV